MQVEGSERREGLLVSMENVVEAKRKGMQGVVTVKRP
jgi:hypothetical protein